MIASSRLGFHGLFLGLTLVFALDHARAQSQTIQPEPTPFQPTPAAIGKIHGIVKSGNMPIPGAAVSISARIF